MCENEEQQEESDMNWKKGTSLVLAGVMASSVLVAGCGKSIDQDAVVATLGEKEISLGFANFMAQYQAITAIFSPHTARICGARIYLETEAL